MAYSDGDDFVSGAIFSYQQANRMKNNFAGASEPSNLSQGQLFSDTDDEKLYHMGSTSTEEVLQLTRSNDKDPQFNEPEIKGLNAVCIGNAVICIGNEIIFNPTF